MNGTHISKIKDKDAKNLATLQLWDEPYHNAIQAAARQLVDAGHPDAYYIGSDSKTIWRLYNGNVVTI